MNLGIDGKTALVTGGAQGIGKAIALELQANGAKVMVTTRNTTALRDMEKLGINSVLIASHESLPGLHLDVPDILVNNAGATLGIKDPLAPIEDYLQVMALNFCLAVELSNQFIPAMKIRGWGRIVNIASISGIENRGPVTFCCAKAALIAYTKSMGRVLAGETPGIVMSAVLPGIVMTEAGHWANATEEHKARYLDREAALKRFGVPGEIAPMVAFLCSKLASFSHGTIVPVDAGLSKGF